MAEYVKVGDSEGFAFYDQNTNELVTLDTDQLGTDQVDLRPATAEEIEGARRGHAASGGGQKTLAAFQAAASGASFGLLNTNLPEDAARSQVLKQQNPLIEGGARLAGSLAPALVAGAAVGPAAGVGRLGAVAVGAAEDLAQAAAYEVSEASQVDRDVEVGNIAQGLLEGAAFLGIGSLAAKGLRRLRGAAKATETGVEAAADAASALPRAEASSAARAEAEFGTPTRAEAKDYVQNRDQIHAEVNDYGYQAGNAMFGRDGSFQKAHNIGYKKTDVAGKMIDANVDAVADTIETFADQAESLAAKLEGSSPVAARSLRSQAKNLRSARARAQLTGVGLAEEGVEDAAIAVDGYKRHLDTLRENFGTAAKRATDPVGAKANLMAIDEILEPTRRNLEDVPTWGKTWAEKQRKENALWTGKDGIIESRAIWQNELMERAPGAAGKVREASGTLPVFQMQGDIVERLTSLNPSKRRQVIKAIEDDLRKTNEMTKIKADIGGDDARAALADVRRDAVHFREAIEEVKRIQHIRDVHGNFLKKAEKLGQVELEDVLERIPGGGALGGLAVRGVKKLANERFTPTAAASRAMGIDELRAGVAARNAKRGRGYAREATRPKVTKATAGSAPRPAPEGAMGPRPAQPGTKAWQQSPERSPAYQRARKIIDRRRSQGGWVELPAFAGPAEAKAVEAVKPLPGAAQYVVDSSLQEIRGRVYARSTSPEEISAMLDENLAEMTPRAKEVALQGAERIQKNHEALQSLPVDANWQAAGYNRDVYRARAEQNRAVIQSLSPAEADALAAYITSEHSRLRAAERGDAGVKKHIAAKVPALYKAAEKLEVYNPTQAGALYRGLNVDDATLADLLSKDEMVTHAITSTSYNPRTAAAFASGDKNPVVLRIKKATVGADPANTIEQEILLPRGAKFKVEARHYSPDPNGGPGHLIIDLKQTGIDHPNAVKGAAALAALVGISAAMEGSASAAEPPAEEPDHEEVANIAAETQAIKAIDEQSRATTERSMLALASADVKLPATPPVVDRFLGDYENLTEAYESKIGQLRKLTDDPMKFVAQVTAAYEPLANAGHPELAAKLITRMQVGIQYLLANQPPALATSMFQPDGAPVDEVAVLQYAPIWEAVWRPLDAVRDIGSRNATPAAVKTLREVHPDVYQRAMVETFRTLAQAGPTVDFETKRYLDNVFGYGPAVGRSFSPSMSNLLAAERQNNQPSVRNLDGESVVGATSPTAIFSNGPSALRG